MHQIATKIRFLNDVKVELTYQDGTSDKEPKTNNHKYYPVLDLVRFICAIFVICIHVFPEGSTSEGMGFDSSIPTLLGESSVFALLRVAVPILFAISGFILFKRIKEDESNKWRYIGKYCLRLLFLYVFWYIIAIPITIRDITTFVSNGDNSGLIRYIVITIWKGAPRGYWFLVSLAISVVIANLFNSKKSLIILIVVASLLYIYGCLNSAYFGLFTLSNDPISKFIYTTGEFLELCFCPLEALLFVVIGKLFANYGTFKMRGNIVILPIIYILMVGELFLTMFTKIFVYANAFFTLPFFVIFFMNLILRIDVQDEKFIQVMKKLKKVASFSYLFHLEFFYYFYWIFDANGITVFKDQFYLAIIPFILVIGLSFGLQTLFEYLSKYKYLKFLKYSY